MCAFEGTSEAIIPQAVKKVAVFDFSGSQDSGVFVAQMLRSHLRQKNHFAILEDEILLLAQQNFPDLFEQSIDPNILRKLGLVLGVDAILLGHIKTLDVNETIEKGNEDIPFIQTDSRLNVHYYLYGTQSGSLLSEKILKYEEVDADKNYRYKNKNEWQLIAERLLLQSAQDIVNHLQTQRSDLGVRHPDGPVSLAGSSHKEHFAPLALEYTRLYQGLLGPELRTTHFMKGDLLWLNCLLKNFKQTEQGEIWVQFYVQIFDRKNRRVVDIPLILDFHQFYKKLGKRPNIPVSLRIQLPDGIESGVYSLRLMIIDRVHNEALLNIDKISIK